MTPRISPKFRQSASAHEVFEALLLEGLSGESVGNMVLLFRIFERWGWAFLAGLFALNGLTQVSEKQVPVDRRENHILGRREEQVSHHG